MKRLKVTMVLLTGTSTIAAIIVIFYLQVPWYYQRYMMRSTSPIPLMNTTEQPQSTLHSTMVQKCSSENLRLLIIVCSAVQNFVPRRAVRETWGSWKYIHGYIAVFFILGRSTNEVHNKLVQEEQETYRDLLLNDFLDTYENLTYKSLAMLKSVSEDCSNVAYVLKADDDVFVNVPNLLKELQGSTLQMNLICGHLLSGLGPHRSNLSKWFVPESVYPDDSYPEFVSGTAYVMSGDVPAKLYAVIRSSPYIYLEDVYVTGLLAENAKVQRRHCNGFSQLRRTFGPCEYRNVISGHYVTPKQMHNIWSRLIINC